MALPDSLIAPTGFNRVKLCRHGYMLYNIHDSFIGRSLDAYGEFTERELVVLTQIVRFGDVVLDVGANIGTHTVPFARWVGPSGAVVAFEPQRLAHQALCANVALNSLANVHVVRAAVGARPGTILLPPVDPERRSNFGGLRLGSYTEGDPVDMVTIDSMDLPGCRLIKLDIEGMEAQALEGARATIARFRPFLYVENEQADNAPALVRLIDSLGYDMYWHSVPYFNRQNFFGNPENIWGQNVVGRNMIGIPKEIRQTMQGFERVEVPSA